MTIVVAGVLQRNGLVLICQRKQTQQHAGQWEFPGGKLERAESPTDALRRELHEELGIEAVPGQELMRYEFAYPGKNPILLIFFAVMHWQGEIQNRICEAVRWEKRESLANYDFLEGDRLFIDGFRSGF